METGDDAGGFRQLVYYPQFRLGVSRLATLAAGTTVAEACTAPAGWRLATSAELLAAGLRVAGEKPPVQVRHTAFRCPFTGFHRLFTAVMLQFYYANQAGWSWYKWGGVVRAWFLAADWETVNPSVGGALFSGYPEGSLTPGSHATAEFLRTQLPTNGFGGAVFVRE